MSQYVYFISMALVLGTIALIFGMKYFSSAYQTRTRAKAEDSYRDLAEKAVAWQSEAAASLAAIRLDLSDARNRLAAVETILKDVG